MAREGSGDLCCGRTWSETRKAAEKGICFRKCRCGSQTAPYEIIPSLPPAGVGAPSVGKIAPGWKELLEKLIIFPSLLINFTIASVSFSPFLLLSRSLLGYTKQVQHEKGLRGVRHGGGRELGALPVSLYFWPFTG